MSFEWGDRLPVLTGRRVALRGLEAGDVPALFAVFSDPRVMRYWSSAPFQVLSDAERLLEDIHEGFRSRGLFQWGLTPAGADEVIGTCTLYRLERNHRRAEIGYALRHADWGRGLASDALATVIGFAFEALDLHRIEADVDPRNDRSLRLLERQGFRREGLLRERYRLNGEIQDAVILGLLRPEWTPAPPP